MLLLSPPPLTTPTLKTPSPAGTIDFPEFFSALNEIDYAGPITFESFSSAVVDPLLSNTLAIWRNLWSDSDDLAAKAHAFIRAGLADN